MHFLKILVGLVIFKLQLRGENRTVFWIQYSDERGETGDHCSAPEARAKFKARL